MKESLKAGLRGVYASLAALAIYATVVGSCTALILLVISMEEGGSTLSAQTIPLTQAVMLLSQGSGFTAGVLTLTIMPLGLTAVLLALTSSLIHHFGLSWPAFFSGGVVWLLLTALQQAPRGLVLVDDTLTLELKSGAVYLLAYALAFAQGGDAWDRLASWTRNHMPATARRTLSIGLRLAVWVIVCLLIGALALVISWIVLYHDSVGRLFSLSRMGTGSRIVTSFAALAWLPNLIMWALSWACGSGFSVGDLAVFTPWSGQARALPSLPIFGLFPDPISSQTPRTLLLLTPALMSFLLAMFFLMSRRGLGLPAAFRRQGLQRLDGTLVASFARCFLSLAVALALCTGAVSLGFLCSSGSLGQHRLAWVGVTVPEATLTLVRGLSVGFLCAWLLFLLVAALTVAWNSGVRGVERSVQLNQAAKSGQSAEDAADVQPKRRSVSRLATSNHASVHPKEANRRESPGSRP
ncbi:hypothetical protein BACT_0719 [Bifidobacterium actinocoloniiforme DSM 22766]|uniref:Lipoprotein n=1 Tax=Bifidobacterium actinocoloniiforme DSM 22766 TaxID=1437605 RepID=A0A086Z0G7_9BIFI|nr:DUF6350 family protein [Bifidobacterium actinocoloniiforme]KFI40017.1 hypothetical protein BACT_0719 [Bifidobacterium actinocoloniiforme DSM 22766]